VILFDKRGTGLSDRVAIATLEERMDDLRAVMDAAGSERAALLGISEGGPMSTLFAATYPERTAALIGLGTFARRMWAPDYPIGVLEEDQRLRDSREWGRPATLDWLQTRAPATTADEEAVRWYTSYLVRGASPGGVLALSRMNREIDVRRVLPTIRVPTLMLYREGEVFAAATRYMGERIPGARLVAVPGDDHLPWEGDQDAVLDEIERFLTGIREDVELDRVLATVLFTDIVGSTARAAELGDRGWGELLERHDRLVRSQLTRFRGREVDTAGDGFFATFDGPARAIRCARAVADGVRELGLEVRAGLHTGEVELRDGEVRGIAVHIGARVAAQAGPGEVLVSSTVKDLVAGSGLEFEDRGSAALKGVPGEWRLYAVRV
jgi:class 3 adenylate cyclase